MITFEMQQLFVIIQITLLAVSFLATFFAWKFTCKAKQHRLTLRGDYVISLGNDDKTTGMFELRAINLTDHDINIDAIGITGDRKFLNLKTELGIDEIIVPPHKNVKLVMEANRLLDLLRKLGNTDHYRLYAIDAKGTLIKGKAKHLAYQLYVIKDATPEPVVLKEPVQEMPLTPETAIIPIPVLEPEMEPVDSIYIGLSL